MYVNIEIIKHVSTIDPTAPDKVFFGLIFVNLGPLNILPKTNPPISEATHPRIVM